MEHNVSLNTLDSKFKHSFNTLHNTGTSQKT